MTAAEPTPREKHYRDLLNTTLARLRRLEKDGAASSGEQRKEAGRIADTITGQLGRTPSE